MEFINLFRSHSIAISSVACRPCSMCEGETESQSYHSLAFVRRGAYKFHQRGNTMIVEPMSAVFFAAHDEYSVSHPFDCGDDCLELRFTDEILDETRPAFRAAGDARRRINIVPIEPNVRWRMNVMARRLETGATSHLEATETAFDILQQAAAFEAGAHGFPAYMNLSRAASRSKVERAKELLLSDVGRDWSLREVANEACVSQFHLTRLFRAHTGATLHRYLNQQRLAVALDRILSGEIDLTGLAFDLGYSSHSHFTAAFKRQYGRPPREARAMGGRRNE